MSAGSVAAHRSRRARRKLSPPPHSCVHRNLKPSNVLVTLRDGVPVPKVIDFGIAKATTDQGLTDKTVFIAFEQLKGTPAYMSPEQAEMSEN